LESAVAEQPTGCAVCMSGCREEGMTAGTGALAMALSRKFTACVNKH
jgi:hypothetical protein